MPLKYIKVEPEVFLVHKNITIVHAYINDLYDNRSDYWYRADPAEKMPCFNVKKLPNPQSKDINTEDGQKEVIINAIDEGHLREWIPPSLVPVKVEKRRRSA